MAAARAAPLARRKALLVAMLIDAYVDRLFAAGGMGEDILAFRAGVMQSSEPLERIMGLCGPGGEPSLAIESVAVPLPEYGQLSVEDFMVSLYNDHSVQRLVIVLSDGTRHDMLDTLAAAITDLFAIGTARAAGSTETARR